MTLPQFPWAFATISKANASDLENEDAIGAHPPSGKFAVSDGATEGWQSGAWSRHLAAAFAKKPPTPIDFDAWLASARGSWQPPPVTGAATWYAEAKSEQGSFATLLGVSFHVAKDGQSLTWKAVAIGDSCLFLIREDAIVSAWPIDTPEGFGNRPALIPSSALAKCPEPDWLAGKCEAGDLFVLATDAGAAGLLKRSDAKLWRSIRTTVAKDAASDRTAALLEWAKAFQTLQNDDITLVAITVPGLTAT